MNSKALRQQSQPSENPWSFYSIRECLKKYSHLAAHIVAESYNELTPENAGRMIISLKLGYIPYNGKGPHDWLEWDKIRLYTSLMNNSNNIKSAVLHCIKNRHQHQFNYSEEKYSPNSPKHNTLFSDSYKRTRSVINSEQVYLAKYKNLCARVMVEMEGKISPFETAQVLKILKEGFENEYAYDSIGGRLEDLSQRFFEYRGIYPKDLIKKALNNRNSQKKTSYKKANKLIHNFLKRNHVKDPQIFFR